eukprot:gene23922-1509_t
MLGSKSHCKAGPMRRNGNALNIEVEKSLPAAKLRGVNAENGRHAEYRGRKAAAEKTAHTQNIRVESHSKAGPKCQRNANGKLPNVRVQKPLSKAKCRKTTNTLKNDKHQQYRCREVLAKQPCAEGPNAEKRRTRRISGSKVAVSRTKMPKNGIHAGPKCRKTAGTLSIGVEIRYRSGLMATTSTLIVGIEKPYRGKRESDLTVSGFFSIIFSIFERISKHPITLIQPSCRPLMSCPHASCSSCPTVMPHFILTLIQSYFILITHSALMHAFTMPKC